MSNILYQEVADYILKKLEKNPTAVLATTDLKGRVTARNMSFIHKGLDLYFQTDSRFLKAQQLSENSRVAVAFENIQIEGVAENRGHSSLRHNTWFCRHYKEIHPGSYNMYTNLTQQLIFRIIPLRITLWKYKDNVVYREILNCSEKTIEKENYFEE